MQSGYIRSNDERITDLETLKKYINEVDALFMTSIGIRSIDLRFVTAELCLFGKSFNNTIQRAGRMRDTEKNLIYLLPSSRSGHWILYRHVASQIEDIKSFYPNHEITNVDLSPVDEILYQGNDEDDDPWGLPF
jgi:hypothetical protein